MPRACGYYVYLWTSNEQAHTTLHSGMMNRQISGSLSRLLLVFVVTLIMLTLPQPEPPLEGSGIDSSSNATRWLRPVASAYSMGTRYQEPEHAYAAGHRGLDYFAPEGTSVQSPESGTVTFAGMVAGKPVLTVEVSDVLRYSFEPLVTDLAVGDVVGRGEYLGVVSEGGHCSNVCLHFGVREHGKYVNPVKFLGGKPRLLPVHG